VAFADGLSWGAEAFAAAFAIALSRASSVSRAFAALLGGAVLARYAGDFVFWAESDALGMHLSARQQVAGHVASYTLLFAAFAWLVARMRRKSALVTFLDAVGVMLGTGLLSWCFLSGPASSGREGWVSLVALLQPAYDVGLLFLGLCVFFTVRSRFSALISGGLLLLVLADGVHLSLLVAGSHELRDGWPKLLWAWGISAFGLAALGHGGVRFPAKQILFSRAGAMLFWLGPFSPPLQLGFLLLWSVLHPPMPTWALVGGAALTAVLAARCLAASRATWAIIGEREGLARETEQGRLLAELHDTAKQGMRGASMLLEAGIKAQERGEGEEVVRGLMGRALEVAKEAEHQLSKTMEDRRLGGMSGAAGPTAYLAHRFEKFGRGFGIEARADLAAPLEALTREEVAAAHRIVIEACWNVAKHSGAKSMWMESRREEAALVLEVRDDGRGFDPEEAEEGEGMGLSFARSRAEEVGAALKVTSARGQGTSMAVVFSAKRA
jgi:signal transduction histidine kinase